MIVDEPGKADGKEIDERMLEGAQALHAACGIYTRQSMVDVVLDAVGWRSDHDLINCRLLEPAAGDGAFVVTVVDRLLKSLAAHGHVPHPNILKERILAFEIHTLEAAKCREAVILLLKGHGLPEREAEGLAETWVREADFLLWPLLPGSFTHVVGNPPYLRWSKLPAPLRARYEKILPATTARGDLFLPFLDRGIEALKVGSKLGFVCTDRWKYMGFAEGFRSSRLPEVTILRDQEITPAEAYVEPATTYPSVVVMQRRRIAKKPARRAHPGVTLKEAGFEVRVGPALGCTQAYVLPLERSHEIEEELLQPWLSPSDVGDGSIKRPSRLVVCLHDTDGKLIDLEEYPKAHTWLSRYREELEQRSIVKNSGAVWYRPIDKVSAAPWRRPKLLVPDLSKIPRYALDASGSIPAHSLYSVQSNISDDKIKHLAEYLSGGVFLREMSRLAPRANGQYLRCYKTILERLVLPSSEFEPRL